MSAQSWPWGGTPHVGRVRTCDGVVGVRVRRAPVSYPGEAGRTVDPVRSGERPAQQRGLPQFVMSSGKGGGDVLGKQSGAEVFRITGARQGLAEDVRGRQRRYVISMSVRTVSVVAAAVLWNVERHVAIVALALGVLLPYVAVVIANAGRENSPSLPSTFVPAATRPVLEAAPMAPPAESAPESGHGFRSPDPQEHG